MATQMTVGRKLTFSFGALIALLAAFAMYSRWAVGRMDDIQNDMADHQIKKIHLVGVLNNLASQLGSSQRDYMIGILTNNAEEVRRSTEDLRSVRVNFEKTLTDVKPMLQTERGRNLAVALDEDLRQFVLIDQEVVRLCERGQMQEAGRIRVEQSEPVLDRLDKETDDLDVAAREVAAAAARVGDDTAAQTRQLDIVMMAVSLAVGAIAIFVVRRISTQLRQMALELGQGAEEVASAASQVSTASQSLARGASDQAASLEETSASSEQINSMAQKNTENSRSAAALVATSQHRFVETNQSLEQTVAAMNEIHTQSGKISRIIQAIDEIAFQTNILALNAAVEAARAGEAGMGFAVVADEVRNLAQRCAQAARDTTALIEESGAKSSDGKAKVDQVAVAIRAMTEDSGKVKTLVGEVDLGSQEQARGIEQIAKAITQMERVTQDAAASAEESAAAAEELNAQSDRLKEVVGRLTAMVGGSEGGSGRFGRAGTEATRDVGLAAHPPVLRATSPGKAVANKPGREAADSFQQDAEFQRF